MTPVNPSNTAHAFHHVIRSLKKIAANTIMAKGCVLPSTEATAVLVNFGLKNMDSAVALCLGSLPNLKDQDAELDKLVAEMNGASADKKLDAVVAIVAKLVEQRKAMHEQMQKTPCLRTF